MLDYFFRSSKTNSSADKAKAFGAVKEPASPIERSKAKKSSRYASQYSVALANQASKRAMSKRIKKVKAKKTIKFADPGSSSSRLASSKSNFQWGGGGSCDVEMRNPPTY